MDAKSSAGRIACEASRIAMNAYQVERSKQVPTHISHTNTEDAATPDGILSTKMKGGDYQTTAIVEAKARYVTYDNILNNPFYERRLVMDLHKLTNCTVLSKALYCEFWSISVFESEGIYLVQRIADKWGQHLADYYTKDTKARESINSSEKIVKPMVYISIEGAKEYRL